MGYSPDEIGPAHDPGRIGPYYFKCQKRIYPFRVIQPVQLPPYANYFAIGFFAGVRPHEIGGLSPRDISDRYIEISARIAKTQKRRLVSVLPSLWEWLRVSEELPLKNKQKRFEKAVKAAGIGRSHDIMRHSYASYHLAHFLSAEKTALEMGHRDTNILFRHYRELVTREEAQAFWAIEPD